MTTKPGGFNTVKAKSQLGEHLLPLRPQRAVPGFLALIFHPDSESAVGGRHVHVFVLVLEGLQLRVLAHPP
jgi:hypothetical protein